MSEAVLARPKLSPPLSDHLLSISFAGNTTDQKLTLIVVEIRNLWGDGKGFTSPQPAPSVTAVPKPDSEAVPATVPEMSETEREASRQSQALSLNLRWMGIEQKIKPLLRAAFQVQGEICCIYSADGDFLCNNPLYELCICRAQGSAGSGDEDFAIIASPGSKYAPMLRPEFLKMRRGISQKFADFSRLHVALRQVQRDGKNLMDTDWRREGNGLRDCHVRTTWRLVASPHLPPDSHFSIGRNSCFEMPSIQR